MSNLPRLIISGLRGGSGKTLLSLGLARALKQDGIRLKVFKKGPDYIDAAWLGLAAGCPASNLDLFFLPPDRLRAFFLQAAKAAGEPADFALIEGNRGLFDGHDAEGSCSTAELARTLACPLVLALDCTKMTRTAAALVAGVNAFEPGLRLAGVVLNNIGSGRHGERVRRAIERCTSVPVLGALPRLKKNPLPERRMGLNLPTPSAPAGSGETEKLLDALAAHVHAHVDIEAVLRLGRSAGPMSRAGLAAPMPPVPPEGTARIGARPRIGYVHDAALWFYYEENLEALDRAGAEPVRLSLLEKADWPRLDGLYLGGGFPEEYAAEIAASPKLALLRRFAQSHMPIYAECGGFLLLVHSLTRGARSYPMAGVFPVRARLHARPRALGYVEAETVLPNPFHPVGARLRGHEFHYTGCTAMRGAELAPALRLSLGAGLVAGRRTPASSGAREKYDGLVHKSVFASYLHIFAPAAPHWAERFAAAAAEYARRV